MEVDPTLVGLPAINVLGVDNQREDMVVVHIEARTSGAGWEGAARRPG